MPESNREEGFFLFLSYNNFYMGKIIFGFFWVLFLTPLPRLALQEDMDGFEPRSAQPDAIVFPNHYTTVLMLSLRC